MIRWLRAAWRRLTRRRRPTPQRQWLTHEQMKAIEDENRRQERNRR